jgi:hypothetical protein
MGAVGRAKQTMFRVVPPWPPGRLVTEIADRAYRLRDRLTHG